MRKLLVALAVFSLFSLPAFAQDTPAFELFGGYSLINLREGIDETGHGFALAAEGSVSDMFGIVGEFGFYDFDGARAYSFMGGPRVSARTETVRPFAHALFGGTRIAEDGGNFSSTYFSMAFGGGIDIVINEMFSIRPAQFDYMPIRFSEEGYAEYVSTIRYSAGAVLTF